MEKKLIKIKGCLTKETERGFAKIKVLNVKDIEKIARKTGSPIFECDEKGELFALDAKNKLKFFRKVK